MAPFALDGGAAARWARERIASAPIAAPIAAPIGVRGFRATPLNAADVVEVPAMGDSITEGSIAAVLKGPGDAVGRIVGCPVDGDGDGRGVGWYVGAVGRGVGWYVGLGTVGRSVGALVGL